MEVILDGSEWKTRAVVGMAYWREKNIYIYRTTELATQQCKTRSRKQVASYRNAGTSRNTGNQLIIVRIRISRHQVGSKGRF